MVPADMPDDFAYRVTELLFDGKERLATVHKAAESLDPKTAREVVEPVQLHPGAQRYYDEGGGWAAAAPARPRRWRSPCSSRCPRSPAAAGRASSCAPRTATRWPAAARGGFALAYRHSVYRAPAEERFRAVPGGFELVAIASPSQAVLDYYALDGRTVRRGRRWVLRPAVRPQFETLALAGTTVGRRTLVAGGERTPLWRRDGRAAHLRITVEGGGR